MGRRQGRVIDKVRWTGDVLVSQLAQSGGLIATNLYQFGDQEDAVTVMRTRGQLLIYLDGAPAAGVAVNVGVGVHVVPKGTDTTPTLSPTSEAEGDWLVWLVCPLAYENYETDDPPGSGMTTCRLEIDSKAMRRMKPGEQLQVVVTNSTVGSAHAVNTIGQFRFLLGS